MMDKHKNPALLIRRKNILAASTLAALIIIAQILVQIFLFRDQTDARGINLAGRQRMLSQRITKLAYFIELHEGDVPESSVIAEFKTSLSQWIKTQHGLQFGDKELQLAPNHDKLVQEKFDDVKLSFEEIVRAAKSILSKIDNVDLGPAENFANISLEVQAIAGFEQIFLNKMDNIVLILQKNAEKKIVLIRQVQLYLTISIILFLLFKIQFIFRPMENMVERQFNELRKSNEELSAEVSKRNQVEETLKVAFQNLEKQNIEIKKQIQDSEKMLKVMVDRELKMAQMKKNIKEGGNE